MILICSKKDDLSADRIRNNLSQRYVRFLNYDIAIFHLHINSYLSCSPNFSIIDKIYTNQIDLDLSKVSAIYFRIPAFPYLPNSKMPEMYQNFLNRELITLFLGQLMALDAKWLIHPFYAHLASYKIVQLKKAKEIGFIIPDTCISTDRQILFDFYQKKKNQNIDIITKAIHLGYVQGKNPNEDELIFTQDTIINSIDNIPENNPLLLQEKIIADYEIRCLIVEDKIFSIKLEIPDKCVDYRAIDSSKIKAKSITLPIQQQEYCLQLIQSFNLNYGAIDLLFSNGKYFFLDLTPTGEWLWYEDNTQLPISQTISDFLIN